ncbi:hypothetical protein Lepto7376_1303 [[Leptolyngbya] sp. PCC 7376]|nr:hypothetical protein Lepto7376_1303 [[Leptolyngbya] sp. PCC 7376]
MLSQSSPVSYFHIKQKFIGQILIDAGLVAQPQLDLALANQHMPIYNHLRLGEIFTLRGWVSQKTLDFFVYRWPKLIVEVRKNGRKIKLGQCLYEADLISREQALIVLKRRKQTNENLYGLMLSYGYLREKTLYYFIGNLYPQTQAKRKLRTLKKFRKSHIIKDVAIRSDQKETFCLNY